MAMLTFQKLDHSKNTVGDPIEVSYNPPELSFSKAANYADINIPGLDAPLLQFVRGSTETLSLELFFDSTENGTGSNAEPVTPRVDEFYQLVKISGDLHTPPIVRILWGEHFPGLRNDQSSRPVPAFDCIVTSCTRKFTLFNPDGVPLRAVVTLALREYRTLEEQLQSLNLQSSDHTRLHVVQEGEDLPLIAYEAYGSAAQWRVIADANDLQDVRMPAPGTVLSLPPTV
ncbi:hypothetical protein [Nitrosomonas sp.]|uniref:CIS tube protein n=1 Tax=Nitrosomonas sp. TaxID=42353 RepID=UPI0033062F58